MGPRLFQDEPGSGREGSEPAGEFRIDPADRPFAASEPDRSPEFWNPGDRSALRIGLTRAGLAILFMAVAAGGLWIAYTKGRGAASGGGVPLIRADQTAMKVKPDNPSGVSEDGDAPVYNVGADGGAKVEQLLPGPEQPLPKPQPLPAPVTPPVIAAAPVPTSPAQSGSAPVPPSPTAAAVPLPATTAAAPPVADTSATPAAKAVAPDDAPPPAAPPPPPIAPPKQVAVAGSGALRIQIAATKDIASAHKEWARLKAAHMDVLGDLKAFGVRVDLGERGIFYRIQAGPIASRADALKRCAALKQSGIGCIIVKQP